MFSCLPLLFPASLFPCSTCLLLEEDVFHFLRYIPQTPCPFPWFSCFLSLLPSSRSSWHISSPLFFLLFFLYSSNYSLIPLFCVYFYFFPLPFSIFFPILFLFLSFLYTSTFFLLPTFLYASNPFLLSLPFFTLLILSYSLFYKYPILSHSLFFYILPIFSLLFFSLHF